MKKYRVRVPCVSFFTVSSCLSFFTSCHLAFLFLLCVILFDCFEVSPAVRGVCVHRRPKLWVWLDFVNCLEMVQNKENWGFSSGFWVLTVEGIKRSKLKNRSKRPRTQVSHLYFYILGHFQVIYEIELNSHTAPQAWAACDARISRCAYRWRTNAHQKKIWAVNKLMISNVATVNVLQTQSHLSGRCGTSWLSNYAQPILFASLFLWQGNPVWSILTLGNIVRVQCDGFFFVFKLFLKPQ